MTSYSFTAWSGQKITCINATPHRDWPDNLLTQDAVYTVASIADTGGLYLIEAPWIAPFKRSRFRPVQSTSTDTGIGQLRTILDDPQGFTPTPTPADEPESAPEAEPQAAPETAPADATAAPEAVPSPVRRRRSRAAT